MWAKLLELLISKIVIKIIEQLAIVLPRIIIDWGEKIKREKEQKLAQDKYNKIKNDVEATEDEIIESHKDYINSGNRK